MYKSSGKKNKASSKVYFSDVSSYSDDEMLDDTEYDSSSFQSPDYYSTGNKNDNNINISNKAGYYQSGQNHTRHGKSSNNYYSPAAAATSNKSGHNYGYYGNNLYPGGSKTDFYSLHGKHGKNSRIEPAYKMNKYQTIVLKIQIHCDACVKKVKKAIADIDGVDSISVDQKQKKVSVTGYIDPKKVLKKVSKTGKSVELVGSKDSTVINHIGGGNNKAALIMAAAAVADKHHHHRHATATTAAKPYTIQVDKSSKQSTMAPYIHRMTPQVRSDMDYMFSDDNANSCSIM